MLLKSLYTMLVDLALCMHPTQPLYVFSHWVLMQDHALLLGFLLFLCTLHYLLVLTGTELA
jgi:hypothetical protein